MTFRNFVEAVKSEVEGLFPPDTYIKTEDVLKNNGLHLCGIVISDGDRKVMPTIYLDPYYDDYESGTSISEIALMIRDRYYNCGTLDGIDGETFSDYANISDKLTYRLVSAERNSELLSDVPHFMYLDMAIVFRVVFGIIDGKYASVLIHNRHIESWGITAEELRDKAFSNTPKREPYEISPLYDIIKEYIETDENDYKCPIYAITNRERAFGAGCILYPGVMDEIAECLGGDYHVLPSSIHEMLLVPARYVSAAKNKNLSELVREVNDTQLCREEILSDHSYYYSAAEHLLKAG